MLICHCEAVNDRKIREVVARGACDEFEVGLEGNAALLGDVVIDLIGPQRIRRILDRPDAAA